MALVMSSSQAEGKAREYLDEAVRQLNKLRLFNRSDKYENAAYYYNKAAVAFKIASNWQEAGDAFIKSAENKMYYDQEAAMDEYVQAARAFKQGSFNRDAVRCYEQAVHHFMAKNKFGTAAKLYREIGEIEEGDYRWRQAVEAYSHAADCHENEDAKSHAMELELKIAEIYANQAEYKEAIDYFEKVAKGSEKNPLIRFNANDYLLRAALCHLPACVSSKDNGAAFKQALARYKDAFFAFSKSRECKFLDKLAAAVEEEDVQAFTDAVAEYDRVSPLDKWRTNVLLMMKRHLKHEDIIDDEDDDYEQLK